MPSCIEKLKGGWRSRANLPLVLLLLALGTLFLFGNDRGHFHRPGHHDWLSSKYLTLAENLSPEHNFARFHRLHPNQNGNSELSFYTTASQSAAMRSSNWPSCHSATICPQRSTPAEC